MRRDDIPVSAARRISADLRPLMLDDLGLVAASEWLVQNFTKRTGVACDLDIGEGDLDLPDPYSTAVFRVLQESLTNIARHAQATEVSVSLVRDDAGITLAIEDDGVGFAPSSQRKPNSFGLLGLRERAQLLGGEISIDSAPGKGTRVRLRIPVEPAGAPA
jgi:two-component system, NarL family, sensor histidine kinase UhpB